MAVTFRRKPCSLGNQRIQLKTKISILPVIAFLAAVVAFIFLPVSAAAASIAFSVTGIVSVLAGDYGRSMEPLRAESRAIPFVAPGRPAAALREAA
jgi:hypothetical protein